MHFPFLISFLFPLTSQAVESIEQFSHSEYVEEHTSKLVKQTTTQVSVVEKVKLKIRKLEYKKILDVSF